MTSSITPTCPPEPVQNVFCSWDSKGQRSEVSPSAGVFSWSKMSWSNIWIFSLVQSEETTSSFKTHLDPRESWGVGGMTCFHGNDHWLLATSRTAPTCVLLHIGDFLFIEVPGTTDSLAAVSVAGPFSRNFTVRRSKGQSEMRFRWRCWKKIL